MTTNIRSFFKQKLYIRYFFYIITFTKKEYTTFEIISFTKKRQSSHWYFNNLFFPILTIFSPLLFYFIDIYFNSIEFKKSVLDLAISGSITLMGLSVLRSAATSFTDKIDNDELTEQGRIIRTQVIKEIDVLKNKLIRISWILTFLGWLFYVIQVVQMVNTKNNAIYWFLFIFILVSGLSIFIGRFMYLVDTNYYQNDAIIELLFEKLREQKSEGEALRDELESKGL
jgi:hypothetical protein